MINIYNLFFRYVWMHGVNRYDVVAPPITPSSLSSRMQLNSACDDMQKNSYDVKEDENTKKPDNDTAIYNHVEQHGDFYSGLLSMTDQFNDHTICEGVYESILLQVLPDLFLEVINASEDLEEPRGQRRRRAATPNEVLDELMHPHMVSVPMTQLDTEEVLIAELKKCNQEKGARVITLDIAGTIFYMSLMHYKGENMSAQLYNDIKQRRIEFVDFTRRSDEKLLYLWDSRQAIVLSLLNDDNIFNNRLFIAMTNLYLPLGDATGTIQQDFVLLDILIRMDAHTGIDALVGVIATGEVILWKYSKEHLRFLFCDFQSPLQRGEDFWIAKRDEFYNVRGLYYESVRKIPRDPDISNLNRIYNIDKEYIKSYPRVYVGKGCVAKQRENFEKWLLLPGRNKSSDEETERLIRTLNRAKDSHSKKTTEAEIKAAAAKDTDNIRKQQYAQRVESRKQSAATKAAEEAAAAAKAAVDAARKDTEKTTSAQGKPLSAISRKAPVILQLSDDDEPTTADNVKTAAVGNKRSSKTRISEEDKSSNQTGVGLVRVVSSSQQASTAVPGQVLTIVIDSSSSTSSSSSSTAQASAAAAEKHTRDLMDTFKITQTQLAIQREKELEQIKQEHHAFMLKKERENLALQAQMHEVRTLAAQRKLDVENQRNQLDHDQESRFYTQMKREADKNSHNVAMSRESASADLDIQRSQFQMRKEIQEWEDRRSANQAQDWRRNVERDSQMAWQRQDALRRENAHTSWYSAELQYSHNRQQSINNQEGVKKRKRREDDDEGDNDEEGGEGDRSDDEEDASNKYIAAPFKLNSARK